MHQIERHHKTRQCQYSSTTYPLSKSDLTTISANPMSETLNAHNKCEVSMQEKNMGYLPDFIFVGLGLS